MDIYIKKIVFILLLIIHLFYNCKKNNNTNDSKKLKIGVTNAEAGSLIFIAESMNFFKKYKSNVKIITFDSGRQAADALLNNEIDICTSGDFVFVCEYDKNTDLRIIGTVSKLNTTKLLHLKTKNIKYPKDLIGKKIAVIKGGSPEFFLDTFLIYHNIPHDAIQYIYLTPKEIEQNLISKNIDAGVLWNPYVYNVQKELQDDVDIWPLHTSRYLYFLLLAKQNNIITKEKSIQKFIKALIKTEEWTKKNTNKTKKIIREKFKYNKDYFDKTVWNDMDLSLELSQELIVSLEDQARWYLKKNNIDNSLIFDNFNYIDINFIKNVDEKRITIIH